MASTPHLQTFLFGMALGLPCVAMGGGDAPLPDLSCPVSYERRTLRLVAMTVDDVARPIPDSTAAGVLESRNTDVSRGWARVEAPMPEQPDTLRLPIYLEIR